MLVLPEHVLNLVGLGVGDLVRVKVRRTEGGNEIAIEPLLSMSGVRTVVEDRYSGAYSGARFQAWPLPLEAIPAGAQGSDIEAGDFWSQHRLCGRGETVEAALEHLEDELRSGALEMLVAAGDVSVVATNEQHAAEPDAVFRALEDARRSGRLPNMVCPAGVRYRASKTHPGLLERVSESGDVTGVGRFKDGAFVAEEEDGENAQGAR